MIQMSLPAFHDIPRHRPILASEAFFLPSFATLSTLCPPGPLHLCPSAFLLSAGWLLHLRGASQGRTPNRLRRAPALWSRWGPAGSWRPSARRVCCARASGCRADACAGLGQVAALARTAALRPAMGCSSSALHKASHGSRLRSGEQGTRPHPRPGLGIRVGSHPGGPKGATGVRPSRREAGSSLRMGLNPERSATPSVRNLAATAVTAEPRAGALRRREPGAGRPRPPVRSRRAGVKARTRSAAAFSETDESLPVTIGAIFS